MHDANACIKCGDKYLYTFTYVQAKVYKNVSQHLMYYAKRKRYR